MTCLGKRGRMVNLCASHITMGPAKEKQR